MVKPKGKSKRAAAKDEFIRVRVTADQKSKMKVAAERTGLDISSWMRMVALKAAETTGRVCSMVERASTANVARKFSATKVSAEREGESVYVCRISPMRRGTRGRTQH